MNYRKNHTNLNYSVLVILWLSYFFIIPPIEANNIQKVINILPSNIANSIKLNAEYYIDSVDNQLFEKIIDRKLSSNVILPNSHTLWCKIVIFNASKSPQNLYLSIFPYAIKQMAISSDNSISENMPIQIIDKFETPILFLPNETKVIWIKTNNLNFKRSFEPELLPEAEFNETTKKRKEIDLKMFGYLFSLIGFLLITCVVAIIQSVILKNITYLYWAFYLLCTSLAFVSELNRTFDFGFLQLSNSAFFITKYTYEGQFLIHLTYLIFIGSYLNLKKENPRIYTFLKLSAYFMVVCFFGFQFIETIPYYKSLFKLAILIANLIMVVIVVLIYFTEILHKKLIVIGSTLLLIFGTFSLVYNIPRSHNLNVFWLLPFVFYSYGVLLELLFFTIALNKKTHLIEQEHKNLQKQYTQNLETELAEKIKTSQQKDKLLEEERIKNITAEFEQKLVQTEIKALRAQMNPHFIFNCLNSIEFFNANNELDKSSEYLTKFSRLIRLVLENSRSDKITLENEFETLKLYIEMESMRFRGKIKYELSIEPEIDLYNTQIPPLLIQPFVENAIWHGLMHKEEGGLVKIIASKINDFLIKIEIIDNGIGRQKAEEFKSKSAVKNKSFGLKVTAERIILINQIYKADTKIEIIDLLLENSQAAGTKVILNIPI